MPAWTDDAITLFGDEDFDTEAFGIPAKIAGLAMSGVKFDPSRTIESITGHMAQELVHVGKTPVFTAEITAKSLLTDGVLNNVAPFTNISRATFGNYVASRRHGFPDTGSFLVTSVSDNSPAGTFPDLTATLKLVTSFTEQVTDIAA